MQVIKEENSSPIKIWTNDIEDSALRQLKNISRLAFIHKNGVAAMPDVHYGIGATIGSVIATTSAIIPAAVGVDIGCGMNAVRLSLKSSDLPENLKEIRLAIEEAVPVGNGMHRDSPYGLNQTWIMSSHSKIMAIKDCPFNKNWIKQLGTLGSGNHFIELCIDENQDVWVMLHSGSRGAGNMIGRHYIDVAKRKMEQYFISLPDKDLAYLPSDTQEFNDYCAAVDWAQEYAFENRRLMMINVLSVLKKHIPIKFKCTNEAINCHHNYISRENHFGQNLWVTRKGAIQAREGSLGIIPGSMGQKSYIVKGKGNEESYCSCSHGAGRKMSRNQAVSQFTVKDLEQQTQGVECRKDNAILDEIPSSYKNIDEVMENQKDLVEVVHTLKQILCVKGG